MADLYNLEAGTVFAGDFRMLRSLSAGGMGAVYVAEQISTGKHRALKVMLPQLVADPALRKRFEQEARIASMIESEHVVEVVGAGIDPAEGVPWLAMELLSGEDLSKMVTRRGALTLPEVMTLFEQLCHAVGAAHRAGIVHRDLKPENIFLAQARRAGVTFTVKVLDFGIAKIVAEAKTKQTAAMGSPIWMAPEQAERSPITPATDVWALGLVAFYLLTGRFYWKAANVEDATIPQLMREVLFEPIVPASARTNELGLPLPPAFDAWFGRCVARDPAARFPDAGQAWAGMAAALGSGGAPVYPQAQAQNLALASTVVPGQAGVPTQVPPTTPAAQPTGGVASYTIPKAEDGRAPATSTPAGKRSAAPTIALALASLAVIAVAAVLGLWLVRTRSTSAAAASSASASSSASSAALDADTTTPPAAVERPAVLDSQPLVMDAGHAQAKAPAVTAAPRVAAPAVTAIPSVAPPPPPPPPPPPTPQRSLADLAHSTTSADWQKAKEVLEPRVIAGSATVDEIQLLLEICRNQKDRTCQRECRVQLRNAHAR